MDVHRTESHGRKKKHHHRRKKAIKFDEIPGVYKIQISEIVQKMLRATVGDTVTTEKPWVYVDKETIQDNLELHEESSEFLPFREKILVYPRDKMLLVYIPDEERPYDEFFICLTEKATDTVDGIIRKQQDNQEKRLLNSINKRIRKWSTLGSEKEILEYTCRAQRPLLDVVIETVYPILPFDIKFSFRKVEAIRDGYMELTTGEETAFNVITKRRIDQMSQISPPIINNESQTSYPFPTNDSTQYEYLISVNPAIFSRYITVIKKYIEDHKDTILDQLRINSNINLYSDDYSDLTANLTPLGSKFTFAPKEFLSFIDVNLCQDKMISSVSWHPLWTGVISVAYVDVSPVLYLKGQASVDYVATTIHQKHIVLIWSFNDNLSPKLILEAHREVSILSFCPFNENILIGGCVNGQVIIWDIRGKLEKVEAEEIMTNSQERYRSYMFSLMDWMKNIYNKALLRPTVISDLRYSHKDAITTICWVNPLNKVTKTGKVEFCNEREGESCQFFTASEDGSVAIWDLHMKPVIQAGGFKPQKRLKRLKARPPALMAESSPLKIFHLNLRPLYRIWISESSETSTPTALGVLFVKAPNLIYAERNNEQRRKLKMTDRVKYSYTPHEMEPSKLNKFHLGTMTGDYTKVSFEGLDFDSGEVVNSEYGKIHSKIKYHDGPVQSISEFDDGKATLTCGGKILALWTPELKDRPVFWRKSKIQYTMALFNATATFRATRADGKVEMWAPYYKSKSYSKIITASSKTITGSFTQKRPQKYPTYGNADVFGSVRLFYLPRTTRLNLGNSVTSFRAFLDRECVRKNRFLAWQEKWNKENVLLIEMKKTKEASVRRAADDSKYEGDEKDITKPTKATLTYVEYEKLDREKRQRETINLMITEKKRLDIPELNKQRRPLQILEQEREKKKRKQRNRLRNSDNIFQETVEMLFPEVAKQKHELPPDPYAGGYTEEERNECFSRYHEYKKMAMQTMIDKPFTYVFDWKKVLSLARERKSLYENKASSHRQRHILHKERKASIEEIAMSTYDIDSQTG